jgi:Serine protease inhibitor
MGLTSCSSDESQSVTAGKKVETSVFVDTFNYEDNASEFGGTVLVPTMEHRISKDSNAVYCATMLYAWDKAREIFQEPIVVPSQYRDLQLLNASTSHKNTLSPSEYMAEAIADSNRVFVRSRFEKDLPFDVKFNTFDNRLKFNGKTVPAFGKAGSYGSECQDQIKILYYQNDRHFLVKLIPEDAAHEILLYMPERPFSTFSEMQRKVSQLIEKGNRERNMEDSKWKYVFSVGDDELLIPKFDFDISTVYRSLLGNHFSVGLQDWTISKAWQQVAFRLDEKGAAVKSEAVVECCLGIGDAPERPQPKKMIFDRPFYVLLKRADASQPYFVLWVANTELMVKE